MSVNAYYPKRIVCLSHDSVETLLALDAKEVIVGRPAGSREDVLGHIPTVGGFGDISLKAGRIFEMKGSEILQPGPRIVEGLQRLHHLISIHWEEEK